MRVVLLWLLCCSAFLFAQNPELQSLAKDFFEWRCVQQPATGDDIPRVERPDGWVPDYSPQALEGYQTTYRDYRQRLDALSMENYSRSDSVDYLLMHSAIERVNWELNVLRTPFRNPDFYVHQTLGAVYELLLIHSPMTEDRARNIILRLQAFPGILEDARRNLTAPVKPFAEIALASLEDISEKMRQMEAGLKKIMPAKFHPDLATANHQAIAALKEYTAWLKNRLPQMSDDFAVGREAYEYFLKNIALIPYTPEEMILMGRQEWERSVSFEVFEELRNRDVPPAPLFSSAEAQIRQSRRDEEAIRRFLEENDIMSVPDWLQHYINKKMPEHIRPLAHMGVVDDLTSPTRLDEDAVSYIPEPSPNLSFFRRASAQDPRPIIVHEGVPGHYFQMALSWRNPNFIRRQFFDSGPNEGIAFYVEEMLLQFGLFDDRPHTREIIYRFMRLRALRVEVDIQLALGNFTIEEAGRYLALTVPMDEETAVHEAGFFAYNPGQAISYQIGKLQILKFLTDARLLQKDDFNLRDFHDYLMRNGNVPISLLRWEKLGLREEIQLFNF